MHKKLIDEIVWWIPFKKLRNSIRELLLYNIETRDLYNNLSTKINNLENNINLINKKINIENEIVFTNIYKTNYWGDAESFSGGGSTIQNTEKLRAGIINIIHKFDIKTILDIPSGDFNWMKNIVNNFDHYIGADIVEEIVNINNLKYSNENIEFKILDICNDKLDKVDLIFTRDCFQHLPIKYVIKAISNIKNSGSKLLMASTVPDIENNLMYEIKLGECRYLNLEKEPFNFPKPLFLLEENKWPTANKHMGIWYINDIPEQSRAEQSRAEQSRAEQ